MADITSGDSDISVLEVVEGMRSNGQNYAKLMMVTGDGVWVDVTVNLLSMKDSIKENDMMITLINQWRDMGEPVPEPPVGLY